MKLSLEWIKDYVDIPSDIELSKLAYDLTMSTVEVEGMTDLAKGFDSIVVGIIEEILPHPNSKKLKLCTTSIGDKTLNIVCGGSNVRTGMRVAVACAGAWVRWHGEGDPVEIKTVRVAGVESEGMICASSEIGLADLFPAAEPAEIVDLSEFDAAAGTPLCDALGLNDIILEIDNKSLTNRPDLWGHYGIARELSAIYNLPLKPFAPFNPPKDKPLKIEIEDDSLCGRYIGVKLEGLCVKPSPFKIKSRLWRAGMRPINCIVDITNYVMLSTGQPTHAFDFDIVKGHITVRPAKSGESLLLLSGKELSLLDDDLIIADCTEPIGLAGIMGGEKDSVLPSTSKVILEIANFNAASIRRTATRYELRTEASARNEKALDPNRCDLALSLAMELFSTCFSATVTGYCDLFPRPLEVNTIDITLSQLQSYLGKSLPKKDISDMLTRLGFEVSFNGSTMHVVVPSWRSTGDVSIPNDIVEEVARIYGLEGFEASPIVTSFDGAINQPSTDIDRKIREYLAFRCGMNEVFTYPWIDESYLNAVFPTKDGMLSLASPPSPEEKYIRSSLIPAMCKAVSINQHSYREFSVFESATVYFDRDFSAPYDKRERLPAQRRHVAGAFAGETDDYNNLFRRAKGVIEMLPRYTHTEAISFEQVKKPTWADDVLWLNLVHCNEVVGSLALLSKRAALDCGIKNHAIMLFELDLDSLQPFPSRTNRFSRLPEYPVTDYDMSLLFAQSVKWEQIRATVLDANIEDLKDVFFVDEYRGKQVPEGKKSVTIRLLLGSNKKTLTSDEMEKHATAIVNRLKQQLSAELRT